ncbi:probable inactive histone-lysine N-methyltransferase SUVR2 isoform X2 [Papaver somniferum]|uniref:probable inactive histone-lysine N-methyltransferase SUVR2 isoform X2 n=1 Tax=Papaver somniferum TaxID=3469 RepID=UPI000E6FEB4D|nr:probable inactive histone-lysine N-methyltransferase SUVR2 isoform X2 [Papaver somniferum]
MTANARALMAFNAMKAIGISGEIVKPVLKNLLKVYDKNWQLIEDENYRVLADAIFEYEENKGNEKQKVEADSHDESGPRLKRLRKKYQEDEPPPSGETSLRRQKGPTHDQLQNGLGEEGMEPSNLGEGVSGLDAVPLNIHIPRRNEEHSLPHDSSIDESEEAPQLHLRRKRSEPEPTSSHIPFKDKGKEPLVLPPSCTRIERVVPTPLRIRDDTAEPMSISPLADQRNKTNGHLSSHPRENKVVTGGAPTVVCTDEAKTKPGADQFPKETLANADQSNRLINPKSEPSSDDFLPLELPVAVIHPPSPDCRRAEDNDRNVSNGHHSVDTSSSRDADAEDESLSGPGTACNNGEVLELANVTEATPANVDIVSSNSGEVNEPQAPSALALDGMDASPGTTVQLTEEVFARPSGETEKTVKPTDPEFPNEGDMRMEQTDPGSSSPLGFVGVQIEMSIPDDIISEDDTPGLLRPLHDVNDIAKGEENFRISAVNEVSSEPYPPLFFYIPQNIIFRSAHVKCTLSRIADEDCCLSCFGDCMSSSVPCACARVTGGDFAYTLEGFLKENFLNECISMNRYPQNHLFYCESCPLERCKNGDLSDPCKGHLERKFIKECWSKCGCNKQCGNRVVQRGISWNLQVFLTVEGKGWGLRTLDDLPRGTFVCEYVGEILTSKELNERNTQIVDGDKQTCPVLLDAAWGSDGVVKDKEALCLDATFYGNVARFINHRCFDANLIEIPVEVESPNHRYYHVALFTTRDVEALEELTWDYGIDFANSNHPVKGFRCRCGSKSCRDMKRSQKAKLNPLVLR